MNPSTLTPFNSYVVDTKELVGNIVRLVLNRPNDFHWQAGDYLWLGLDETNLKPFSIANLFSETTQTIHCDIALTDSLADWWQTLIQAQACVIKGPVSQYHWPKGDAPVYLLAGGTGITPLLALLSAHEAELNERVVTLYWGVRRAELLFVRDALDRLAKIYPKFHWQAVVSDETDLSWTGAKGNLPDVVKLSLTHCQHDEWLICGPWPMVQLIKNWLLEQSVDSTHIQ